MYIKVFSENIKKKFLFFVFLKRILTLVCPSALPERITADSCLTEESGDASKLQGKI